MPMKKLISVLLLLVLCLSICACGQDQTISTENPGTEPTQQTQPQKLELEVGQIYDFGQYEQDGNSDTTEAISWQVLAVEDGKALLISQYALDVQLFHTDWSNTSWENCTMRTWLNKDFWNNAFTPEEQARVLTTTVIADSNSEYTSDPGNDTQDKVFLLSIQEVLTLMPEKDSRKCQGTEYAKSCDLWLSEDGYCNWWLRTPGQNESYTSVVWSSGGIDTEGCYVIYGDKGVRPVIWLNLDN